MPDLTRILEAAQKGDGRAAADLLPLVYDELRKLAAAKMAAEAPGHTLNATALVHEAFLRLIGDQQFDGRGHFFGAAAEAMRRILIENARRKRRERHGGDRDRVQLHADIATAPEPNDEILAVDEALEQLSRDDPSLAELVKLHYFGGLTIEQAAELLGISPRTAYRNWAFAKAWLFRRLGDQSQK